MKEGGLKTSIFAYFPKHDLQRILNCHTCNSATQKPFSLATKHNLPFLMVATGNHNFIEYQKSSPAGLYLEFEMWRHFDKNKNQNNLLCAIVFDFVDCVVFEISKIQGPGKPLQSLTGKLQGRITTQGDPCSHYRE